MAWWLCRAVDTSGVIESIPSFFGRNRAQERELASKVAQEAVDIGSLNRHLLQTHQILRSGLEMPQAPGETPSLWSCGWWVPIWVVC